MSRTCLYCQNHVQRLRVSVEVTDISGSRGLVPGILRSLLSLCCSNSRRGFVSPVDWDWQVLPVRLCECEPWAVAGVKSAGQNHCSEIPAKIAAFFLQKVTARFSSAPKSADGVSGGQALSRTQYFFTSTACWLGVRTGTFPPLSFHGPPPFALPLTRPSGTLSRWKKRERAIASAFSRASSREKVAEGRMRGLCSAPQHIFSHTPLTLFFICSNCRPCPPKRDSVHDGEPDGGAAGFVERVNVAQSAFLLDHPRPLRGLPCKPGQVVGRQWHPQPCAVGP